MCECDRDYDRDLFHEENELGYSCYDDLGLTKFSRYFAVSQIFGVTKYDKIRST
jgi:hypothetical protein